MHFERNNDARKHNEHLGSEHLTKKREMTEMMQQLIRTERG